MSQITPQMVKDLREKTGAGMGDCKKALTESNGDMQAAIEFLRKKGAASAAKRAERSANEGLVLTHTSDDGKKGVIIEINCETDFVSRNAEFENYANKVKEAYFTNDVNSVEELMKVTIGDETIEGLHSEILAKFSEKIEVRRFTKFSTDGFLGDYVHAGNRLAVMIDVTAVNPNEQAIQMIRDIAMQIAAMNPQFIDKTQVDQATIEKEKEIYKQQAIEQGKKDDIADRIATGRLEKFYTEQCLIEQSFVKDGNKSVKDVLKEISELVGSEVKVNNFVRYALGDSE